MEITGADAGFQSVRWVLKTDKIKIIADLLLEGTDELISGANKNDYHIKTLT